jgi:hypothetical protein
VTILAIFCLPLLCAALSIGAQGNTPPVIACNAKAIAAAERPHYNDLMRCLRLAARERREIDNGYVFKLDGQVLSLPEVAEWISMERRCCPFLTFQLSASGNQSGWTLKLTGPTGVKALLQAEFPDAHNRTD